MCNKYYKINYKLQRIAKYRVSPLLEIVQGDHLKIHYLIYYHRRNYRAIKLSGLEPIVKMFKRGKGLYTCMTISLWSCPFTNLGGFERLMVGLSPPKPPYLRLCLLP